MCVFSVVFYKFVCVRGLRRPRGAVRAIRVGTAVCAGVRLGVGAIWLQEAREREEAEARARESAYQAEMEQRAKCLWRGEAGAHAGQRRCQTSFMDVSVTSLAEGGNGDVPRVVGFRGLLLTGVSLHRSQWIRCAPPSRTSTPATTRTPPAKSVPRTRSPHD